MKRLFLLTAFGLIGFLRGYGQHLQYPKVFAPSESLVKESEKPYRRDLCLNGSWQFQPVKLPQGFREAVDAPPVLPPVQPDSWDKTPIRIPSPWNVNSFADNNGEGGDFRTFPSYPKEWENIKMGWLRRTFKVPQNWNGKRLLLHFDALAGDAQIMVNGKQAGTHFGIFLPFDIDVTDFIKTGQENEITIGIRKASLFDKRGNYGRRTYQAGSFWGQHIAGIWQDVYLVALPKVYVEDAYVKPDLQTDRLTEELIIRNESDKAVSVSVDANAFKWQALNANDAAEAGGKLSSTAALNIPAVKVEIEPHSKTKVVLSGIVKGKLDSWSPENPNLYGLLASVKQGNTTLDTKYTRFGWRSIKIQGGQVLLNGKPVIMKGDSWHFLGIPQMTRRYAVAWFKAMRDANLNTVRLHAQPYPSFYMDVADEMGILVLDETAVWASDGGPKLDDTHFWQDTKQHLSELILRDRNHPSVFGWSVSNEVMPVVTNVMRNPPGVKDTLVKYYGIWAGICRRLDPTREWISADGEDDGEGNFPAYIIHYGSTGTMDRGKGSGKPWGVGEAGTAYYGTPEQVAETNGDRAYESFLGRMEGVASSSYENLFQQRQRDAVYRSVFNLVWYGLKPLPLGMKDITKAPTPDDGIFFADYKENMPGVQPERLGPYSTTLNPGYDPSLPAYQTWPLFDAIKDAAAEPLAGEDRWLKKPATIKPAGPVKKAGSLALLAGSGSTLADDLQKQGVKIAVNGKITPRILFIDGSHPPAAESKTLINKVLAGGGTVMVWGANAGGLSALNQLLPARLELTERSSSSLLSVTPDVVTAGIGASDLYFSELKPAEIITNGLDGELVKQSKVLLAANNTDWQKWNKQPEYAKTAMVVRSEQEAKPSGAAMILYNAGPGCLIVTTLQATPKLFKAARLVRLLLKNLGIEPEQSTAGDAILKNGKIVRGLFMGGFEAQSPDEAANKNFVSPSSAERIKEGSRLNDNTWEPVFNQIGQFDLKGSNNGEGGKNEVAYLSFWVSSQRSLEDLLAEPNIPVVNMEIAKSSAAQVFLNGRMIINNLQGGNAKAEALKLRRGWNHFLIKLIRTDDHWQFSGNLSSDQPAFQESLGSAIEKP